MTLLVVFTTLPDHASASGMAHALVERQLVACAQLEAIESYCSWKGAVQHEPEYRLMLKTTVDRYSALEAAIRERHPYELPAIYAIPVTHAYTPYAEWVAQGVVGQLD